MDLASLDDEPGEDSDDELKSEEDDILMLSKDLAPPKKPKIVATSSTRTGYTPVDKIFAVIGPEAPKKTSASAGKHMRQKSQITTSTATQRTVQRDEPKSREALTLLDFGMDIFDGAAHTPAHPAAAPVDHFPMAPPRDKRSAAKATGVKMDATQLVPKLWSLYDSNFLRVNVNYISLFLLYWRLPNVYLCCAFVVFCSKIHEKCYS